MNRSDLHDYQLFCCSYILSHPQSMIFLDCGLGKTIITLTAISDLLFDSFEISKVLVIAPLRVARNVWTEEVRSWSHVSFLKTSVIVGTPAQRIAALNAPADICIINRENVKWLTDHLETTRTPWPFDMVVIDELSSFKNHESQRWKALRKVRPRISRVVGLTGTPATNGLMDLWAETYLIDGGERLGRFIGRYRQVFFLPSDMNPYTGVIYNYRLRPGAEEAIHSRISDITVSLKAMDCLRMPEQVMVNHFVEMGPLEFLTYEKMKKDLLIYLDGGIIDAANAAVLTGKLLQMANGAIYNERQEVSRLHDKKLEMLGDLIEQANGQNVLVAYWFGHDHDRIVEYLSAQGYEPRDLKTDEDISDWNSGKIQIALISPASAGHGLNIQKGGHILIWFSMVWSLELYQQTNARLWRQGQKETVLIHHILTRNTIDQNVLSALQSKDNIQQKLINAVKAEVNIA